MVTGKWLSTQSRIYLRIHAPDHMKDWVFAAHEQHEHGKSAGSKTADFTNQEQTKQETNVNMKIKHNPGENRCSCKIQEGQLAKNWLTVNV